MWWNRKTTTAIKNQPAPGVPNAPGPARFLDPEVLARIGSLELLARAVVEGFMSGLHRSPFTGFSTEFTEYRQYNPGDDLRYLDWRLLARTDRYFIKKYRADTNTQCHILIDTSASMRYSQAGRISKLQYAKFLAASLAYLLNRQQDAVGVVAFDQHIHTHVPARSRTGHMRTIFGQLSMLEAGGEHRQMAEDRAHVSGTVARRHVRVDFVGKGDHTDSVLLPVQEVSKRRREILCILKFRNRTRVGIVH